LADGRYVSHNWDKRQFKSDTSNERVKRYRERFRKQDCNVTPLLPETPPETEQNRTEHSARDASIDLRVAVVKTFEKANSPTIPDTSRVDLWLSQGYEPSIITATIATILARKPEISALNYFDGAIREAHEKRAPKVEKPKPINWERFVGIYKNGSPWPHALGPEPGYAGCRAPPEILEQHGYLKRQAAE
jgi:hypothetical protein